MVEDAFEEAQCAGGVGEGRGICETLNSVAARPGHGGAYQSSGVGAINAEQGDGSAGLLGRGGIGTQAVDGGGARDGELGGTEASAGEASGHHCAIGWRTSRREERHRGVGLGDDIEAVAFVQGCKVENAGPNVPVVTWPHTELEVTCISALGSTSLSLFP